MRTTTKKMMMRKRKTVITDRRALKLAPLFSIAILVSSAFALKDPQKQQPYALIAGTVYGPDDRPAYGVKVQIRPLGKKHPTWERYSDHRGEFAQRVPLEHSDYELFAEADIAQVVAGKPQHSGKKRVKATAKVHVDKDTISDVGLHLKE
jgi:hypothetical protein